MSKPAPDSQLLPAGLTLHELDGWIDNLWDAHGDTFHIALEPFAFGGMFQGQRERVVHRGVLVLCDREQSVNVVRFCPPDLKDVVPAGFMLLSANLYGETEPRAVVLREALVSSVQELTTHHTLVFLTTGEKLTVNESLLEVLIRQGIARAH